MNTREENDFVTSATNFQDQELIAKIPPLSVGKTKHFFVSYASLDKDRVFSVIEEIEKRFGLQCIFDERDFQGGKDITVNIREGIMSSLKVLIFLTPDFLMSGWCKYETDAAFISSMGCGYSCIVPVLLEECEIPPTLVTLTYIDATIPGLDVPKKIAASLLRKATDDGLFSNMNIRVLNRQYENGYCYIIPGKRDNLSVIRPAKYRFSVDSNLIQRLKENKVAVPEKLLKKTVDILNKDLLMCSYDYFSRWKNCCWLFLLIPLYVLIFFVAKYIWILEILTRTRNSGNLFSIFVSAVTSIMIFTFIFIQIVTCCLVPCCRSKRRDKSVQDKLWRNVGKECIENNILFLFTGRRRNKPSKNSLTKFHLIVMRYDIERCKEYFIGIMKTRKITPVDSNLTPEMYADLLIERHLSQCFSNLADDFDFLPDAPYNRHNVKKGKMCICQQLEHSL